MLANTSHFAIYKYQLNMVNFLNFYNVIYQMYLK